MRSFIVALALAAPLSAVAATPNYSNPLSEMHHKYSQDVELTFINSTVQDRELVIGDKEYKMTGVSSLHLYVPVGTPVFVYSNTNTQVNGQELMRVSANDQDKSIRLR